MNANQFINSRVGGYVALGCLGAAVVWYIAKKIPSVQSAVNAVSPLNNDNVFKKSVDAIGEGFTGNDSWSLGGAIYDMTHTDYSPNDPGSGGFDWSSLTNIINPASWAGEKLAEKFNESEWPQLEFLDYVNPASDKNVVYQGVNKIGSTVSGDSDFSLGSWIYDLLNPPKVITNVKTDDDYKNYLINNTDSISDSNW